MLRLTLLQMQLSLEGKARLMKLRLMVRLASSKITRRHILYGTLISLSLLGSSLVLLRMSPYQAHKSYQFFRANVVTVQTIRSESLGQNVVIHARLLDGPDKGTMASIEGALSIGDKAAQRLPIGSQVLLYKDSSNGNQYGLDSRWHMPGMATLLIILFALVIVVGAWRGITSVFGLTVSIFIIVAFVIPRIIDGHNAFATCIEAAIVITLASIYLAHGFSKRTTIALLASLLTLLAIVGLTALASYITGTSEIVSEDDIGVLYTAHHIDVAGLLTGGVVIASLGALYDITTGQAASIDEIHKADRKQSSTQLFWKGMSVGREHIAALINTLALVYIGVALPTTISTIIVNQQANYHVPLLVNLNGEALAEEVMRTCVAGIGVLLALPVTTWLAAYILPRWTPTATDRFRRWFKSL